MTWEKLAEKAYEEYYLDEHWFGWSEAGTKSQSDWIRVVKTIYNLAQEDARVMIVESICSGGL